MNNFDNKVVAIGIDGSIQIGSSDQRLDSLERELLGNGFTPLLYTTPEGLVFWCQALRDIDEMIANDSNSLATEGFHTALRNFVDDDPCSLLALTLKGLCAFYSSPQSDLKPGFSTHDLMGDIGRILLNSMDIKKWDNDWEYVVTDLPQSSNPDVLKIIEEIFRDYKSFGRNIIDLMAFKKIKNLDVQYFKSVLSVLYYSLNISIKNNGNLYNKNRTTPQTPFMLL